MPKGKGAYLLENLQITPVQKGDLIDLHTALQNLSETLGDSHRADVDGLNAVVFGPDPAIRAMVARIAGAMVGAVVFSPVYSTVLGMAGLYVSDLWVSDKDRGQGIGQALLAEAALWAQDLWQAGYMKLSVYDTSAGAQKFYDRLGFSAQTGAQNLILDTSGLTALKGSR